MGIVYSRTSRNITNRKKISWKVLTNGWVSSIKTNFVAVNSQTSQTSTYSLPLSQLYAVLKSKWNSRHFRNFIENKTPKQFLAWFRRMSALCRFNPERLTILWCCDASSLYNYWAINKSTSDIYWRGTPVLAAFNGSQSPVLREHQRPRVSSPLLCRRWVLHRDYIHIRTSTWNQNVR